MEKLTSATERIRPSSVGKLVLRWLTVRRGMSLAFVITKSSSAWGPASRARHRPAGLVRVLLAARDHGAPGRDLGRHADTEERQPRLGQDGVGEDERHLHE